MKKRPMSFLSKASNPRARKDESLSAHSVDSQALTDDAHANGRKNMRGTSYGVKQTNMHARSSLEKDSLVAPDDEKKHILASRYKTKRCKNYLATGACPYEIRCMFAHGEEELRTAEQNMADGLTSEEAIKAFQHRRFSNNRRHTMSNGNSRGHVKNSNSSSNSNSNNNHAADAVPAAVSTNDLAAAAEDALVEQMAVIEDSRNDMADYYDSNNGMNVNMRVPGYGYFYTHNPYALDLLAPEDRLYSTAYVNGPQQPMIMYGEEGQNFFPTEDMEEDYPVAYDASNHSYPAYTGGNGCSAVELEESNPAREMILEP